MGHRTGRGRALLSDVHPLPFPFQLEAQPRSIEYKGACTVLISHSCQVTSFDKTKVISSSNHRSAPAFLTARPEGPQRSPGTALI